jgi:hypothetical protein
MRVYERDLEISVTGAACSLLAHLGREVESRMRPEEIPIRLAVTSNAGAWHCEVGVLDFGFPTKTYPQISQTDADQNESLSIHLRQSAKSADNFGLLSGSAE